MKKKQSVITWKTDGLHFYALAKGVSVTLGRTINNELAIIGMVTYAITRDVDRKLLSKFMVELGEKLIE